MAGQLVKYLDTNYANRRKLPDNSHLTTAPNNYIPFTPSPNQPTPSSVDPQPILS